MKGKCQIRYLVRMEWENWSNERPLSAMTSLKGAEYKPQDMQFCVHQQSKAARIQLDQKYYSLLTAT